MCLNVKSAAVTASQASDNSELSFGAGLNTYVTCFLLQQVRSSIVLVVCSNI